MYYLTFRTAETAGSIGNGEAFSWNPAHPDQHNMMTLQQLGAAADGMNVLFVVHGFNVAARSGKFSASAMQEDFRTFALPYLFSATDMVVGVLWPGDWHVKIINYPWEAHDAVRCGDNLRNVIRDNFMRANSISMASHSLGARVVLSAAAQLKGIKRLRELCITAAAADENTLTRQYPNAVENSDRVSVLRSKRDLTLQFAYPAGDFFSDLFGDNDSPFRGALGRHGPRPAAPSNVQTTKIPSKPHDPSNSQTEQLSDFDHTDYFPKSDSPRPTGLRKSDAVSRYIAGAFAQLPAYWR